MATKTAQKPRMSPAEMKIWVGNYIAEAIRVGRHQPIEQWPGTVCPRCREWKGPTWIHMVDADGKKVPGSERIAHVCGCDVKE